jgi:hypothetical protein
MNAFTEKYGISRDKGDFGQDLEEALNSGYTKGCNGENQRGALPEV